MIYKKKTHKGKIVLMSLAIAGAVGMYVISNGNSVSAQSSSLDSNNTQMMAGNVSGPGLISIVDKIESIRLDGSIFSDNVFMSFEDRTIALPTPILGRSNPFAPIGSQTSGSQTTSSSSSTAKASR